MGHEEQALMPDHDDIPRLALANAAVVCGRLVRRAWTHYRWDGRPRRRP
jgi:hypothetical protein